MLVDRGMEQDYQEETMPDEGSINHELEELTKYVEVVTKTIREMEQPVTSTSDQLPQATNHLHDLAAMTEEGTHKVLALTEELERNRQTLDQKLQDFEALLPPAAGKELQAIRTLVNSDERRLMDIHVALSFQDLVAQRVAKLVAILNEVQHKLLKLVVVFGIQQKKQGEKVVNEGKGYEMLKQLDASKTTSLNQDLVDDILSEFGCL